MADDRKKPWFLKEWRVKRGLTQQALADLVETSKGYISELENGERRYNQDLLEGFARALGCEPRDLLAPPPGDHDPDPNIDPVDPADEAAWRAASSAQRRIMLATARALREEEEAVAASKEASG